VISMELKGFSYALIALLAFQGCSASSQSAPKIGVYGLSSQRISGAESVRVPGVSGFSQVSVLVTVDVDGNVTNAKVADDRLDGDASAALAAARNWKFRPQSFDGKPIQAVGGITIEFDPPEIPPDTSVPFPTAVPEDIEITLERNACYGSCPDYRVTIKGDGKIRFSTREMNFPGTAAEVHRMFNGQNVLWAGTHEADVGPQAVADLVERFRSSHFMGLKPEYVAGVTDNPTYALTLRVGKVTKRVVDYVGKEVGMPASVTALEDAVDEVAGTDRWVRGNAQTVALLKAQGFNFRSRDAAELVQSAIQLNRWPPEQAGANELIQAAIAEGLDLSTPVGVGVPRRSNESATIGSVIAQYAAETGNVTLFEEMKRAGQVARMTKKSLDSAFMSDMGCRAEIAKALVEAGANSKAVGENGNALHALRSSYGRCADSSSAERVEMAAALVALGVPLEARDSIGWTPLMGSDDPAVAQTLLKAGANLNAKNDDGTTAVLSLDDDRVVLTLLRAGADPKAKDGDGTLRQQARKRHWPGTLAWLNEHGIK
jgi:TonB family protein